MYVILHNYNLSKNEISHNQPIKNLMYECYFKLTVGGSRMKLYNVKFISLSCFTHLFIDFYMNIYIFITLTVYFE